MSTAQLRQLHSWFTDRGPGWVTRFAPSPTGYLHRGHVVNMLYVWGLARAYGGQVVLRIEDHDRSRSRPEYIQAILADLAWLGLAPDVLPEDAPEGQYWYQQSQHHQRYQYLLQLLRLHHQVYACTCSRKQILEHAPQPADAEELYYPGTCRALGLDFGPDAGVRLALPQAEYVFKDLWLGLQRQVPATQCGDLLLRDRLQQWTYQFAVVADDMDQEIDVVIRGQDLLASTGRQLQLAAMLGRQEMPAYLHHPLLTDATGHKLSKRDWATSLAELRSMGATPQGILGEAAWQAGLLPALAPLDGSQLAALFLQPRTGG